MAWTDDRVEILKKLWAEGLSASQIATQMGGVTRNAVIGKVHRLGLSGRATPTKPSRGIENVPSVPHTPKLLDDKLDIKPILADPAFSTPIILDTGDKTTLPTLSKNMCKWPNGDPASDDFHFCGQPSPSGRSYCAYHAQMAFQPSHKRERAPVQKMALPVSKRAAG